MFSDLLCTLRKGDAFYLSTATQYWDYLDADDSAEVLGEYGRDGEIYNIVNGDLHPLRYFTELIHREIMPTGELVYDEQNRPAFSLRPSVKKIQNLDGF